MSQLHEKPKVRNKITKKIGVRHTNAHAQIALPAGQSESSYRQTVLRRWPAAVGLSIRRMSFLAFDFRLTRFVSAAVVKDFIKLRVPEIAIICPISIIILVNEDDV